MFFSGKNHKEQKIEQLLLENYNKYYRLAYSYVHHEADAADIVQNGAYKAVSYTHLRQNLCADRRRQRGGRADGRTTPPGTENCGPPHAGGWRKGV